MTAHQHNTTADHAAQLSNIRNRLNTAATHANFARLGTNEPGLRRIIDHLIHVIDDVHDELHPYAFPATDDVEAWLAVSAAVDHARAARPYQAATVLADCFGPDLQAVSA